MSVFVFLVSVLELVITAFVCRGWYIPSVEGREGSGMNRGASVGFWW
jgi:hypothetical protein